jgi:hypothetical protein
MFKNITLAVLVAIIVTYSLGHLTTQWLDLRVLFAEYDFEPISTILLFTGIVAIVMTVGLFVAGLSVFWPAILFILVVFLWVRDKQTPAH